MDNTLIRNNQYNIGYICTTQQCENGLTDKVAFRWVNANGERTDYTYGELDKQSNLFANVLGELGFSAGDVFFTYLPKLPETYFAFLGTLKAQVICGTMFSNFGEDALLDRLGDSGARGIITKKSLLNKIRRIKDRLPELKVIIVVDADEDGSPQENTYSLKKLISKVSAEYTTAVTAGNVPSVLHYTSGSTGKPKGVLHHHRSVISQNQTSREILGLGSNDIYWCTADPGWVTGTSYGIIGPWSLGVTQVHYGGGYDAQEWFNLLAREQITVWYTAPTALRMLMREDEAIFTSVNLQNLRHIFSVGEPLNPEVIKWSKRLLNREIYDTWFQTETGAIMISNRPGLSIRPGSMGVPVQGIEPVIVADNGDEVSDGVQGNLCIKPGWPSMFITYLHKDVLYGQKFVNGLYHTGDTARCDKDGYYWFMGRSDDVINTSGHLVSPFEVESALLEMVEVAESGVIAAADELLYEKIVAYIQLHTAFSPNSELELKIKLHVSNKLSSIACPQEIIFCDGIPKNKSGKIMRRVLKARYVGEDPGDISTLEI